MSLESLPTEILCMILRFVGSTELRKQNVCCLLVCQWWYKLVRPIILEDLVLSTRILSRVPWESAGLKSCVRRISIHLKGLERQLADGDQLSSDEEISISRLKESLHRQLNGLVLSLPRYRHLKSFTLEALSEFDPARPLARLAPRHEYLSTWSMIGLAGALRVTDISDLMIDTCGSELEGSIHDHHICPLFACQIPSLRSVRLRMRRICPAVLELQQNCDQISTSRLESLIINLSLKEGDGFFSGYSDHCVEMRRGWDLYDDMVTAATLAAKKLKSLKVLRILCHKHPSLDVVSRDCITGHKTILREDGNWDWGDDGQTDYDDDEPSDQGFYSTDTDSDVPDPGHQTPTMMIDML